MIAGIVFNPKIHTQFRNYALGIRFSFAIVSKSLNGEVDIRFAESNI